MKMDDYFDPGTRCLKCVICEKHKISIVGCIASNIGGWFNFKDGSQLPMCIDCGKFIDNYTSMMEVYHEEYEAQVGMD